MRPVNQQGGREAEIAVMIGGWGWLNGFESMGRRLEEDFTSAQLDVVAIKTRSFPGENVGWFATTAKAMI
jgi:hypothetical protein